MADSLIDATTRFSRAPEPAAEMRARQEVVRRARQTVMPRSGSNDNNLKSD